MLWARASKVVVDDYAPEVSLGLVTKEEVEEIEAVPLAEYDSATDADFGPAPDPDLTPADEEIEWPEPEEVGA
jgi:hypothetical protein